MSAEDKTYRVYDVDDSDPSDAAEVLAAGAEEAAITYHKSYDAITSACKESRTVVVYGPGGERTVWETSCKAVQL